MSERGALEVLLSRRSCAVAMMGEPGPTQEELRTILRAGVRVPDHGKLAPWRIQVLEEHGQERLGETLAEIFAAEHPDAGAKEIASERSWPTQAPLLLVVTGRIRADHEIPEVEQMLSGGAMCQNILLAAHALGYAGQWLTEWPAFHAEVKRALGHDSSDEILGFIFLGTATTPPAERRRVGIEDVALRWDGEPGTLGAPLAAE
jgi:nitroreductase